MATKKAQETSCAQRMPMGLEKCGITPSLGSGITVAHLTTGALAW
ncbi:MAG: hypothetical protein AAF282_03905 [Cyanobacteria bacterium P01_A01_bin.15]